MYAVIPDLLDAPMRAQVAEAVEKMSFIDGRATAGKHASPVKNNLQIDLDNPVFRDLRIKLSEAIFSNPMFDCAVRPARPPFVMINRYDTGMSYGTHIDNPAIGRVRTDVSFTVFLNDPKSYDGGELVMETPMGEVPYKLPVGTAIAYPASTLHHVNPITRGSRLAVVGWAQSYVRDPAKRELLLDLEIVTRRIFEQQGKTPVFDALAKSHANLLRMWIET